MSGAFLDVRIPKVLLIADKERMDKEMIIAHMQGNISF